MGDDTLSVSMEITELEILQRGDRRIYEFVLEHLARKAAVAIAERASEEGWIEKTMDPMRNAASFRLTVRVSGLDRSPNRNTPFYDVPHYQKIIQEPWMLYQPDLPPNKPEEPMGVAKAKKAKEAAISQIDNVAVFTVPAESKKLLEEIREHIDGAIRYCAMQLNPFKKGKK